MQHLTYVFCLNSILMCIVAVSSGSCSLAYLYLVPFLYSSYDSHSLSNLYFNIEHEEIFYLLILNLRLTVDRLSTFTYKKLISVKLKTTVETDINRF